MKHLMDKNEAGQIIDGAIYNLLEAECAALEPHVTALSGGQMRKDGGGKLNAYKAVSVDLIVANHLRSTCMSGCIKNPLFALF